MKSTLRPHFALVMLVLLLVSGACRNERKSLQDEISGLEKGLIDKTTGLYDLKKSQQLIEFYDEYSARYQNDSLAPKYLIRAAELSMNTQQAEKAIALFDKARQMFPAYRGAGYCLFMKAFTYENLLHDRRKAEETYKAFISEYPGDGFADDARTLLKQLYMTEEELARSFEGIEGKPDTTQ